MDIHSAKIELIKAIRSIENEAVIQKLKDALLGKKNDYWLELTDAEREEIDLGLQQINRGETENWDNVLKRIYN